MSSRQLWRYWYERSYGPMTDRQYENFLRYHAYSQAKRHSRSFVPWFARYEANRADQMEYEEKQRMLSDREAYYGINRWDNPYPISNIAGKYGVEPYSNVEFAVNEAIMELYNGTKSIVKKQFRPKKDYQKNVYVYNLR